MEAKKCEKKPMTKGENLHKYLRRDVWPLSSYVSVDSFFFDSAFLPLVLSAGDDNGEGK